MFAQGAITTYAGGGGAFTGDGKLASGAQIARPSDVSVDSKGNVYFTSPPLNLILKIATDGTLNIVAGNGLGAHSGDGGPARRGIVSALERAPGCGRQCFYR
jgi:hypothetical protein